MVRIPINRIVEDSADNYEQVRAFCQAGTVGRIYSQWQSLGKFYELLDMLGYTTQLVGTGPHDIKYDVVTWFGREQDADEARNLIYSLTGE